MMNCLEAQSKIVAFIEDKLSDDEELEFIRHIRNCDNCAEELEIYYTLLVGMKQLDEDKVLTTDFKTQMEEKLNAQYKHISNRRKITRSSVAVIAAAVLVFTFLGYESYRAATYQKEQEAIKASQSEYYYYDAFGSALFHPEDYQEFHLSDYLNPDGPTDGVRYYERLRTYLETNNQGQMNPEQEGAEDSE